MPTREGDLSIEAHGMEPIPESARYGSVGRTFTARPASAVTVQVGSGSNSRPPRPVSASNTPDNADLFAADLTSDQLPPGTWQIEFHAGGKIVASGFLTVTP